MGMAPKNIGVSQIHVARLLTDERGAVPTYDDPIWIPEAKEVNVVPRSNTNPYYTDDVVSEIFQKTTGGTITAITGGLSLESMMIIRGMTPLASADAGLLDDMAVSSNYVAFGYRRKINGKTSDGRQRYRYVWIYKTMFSPPSDEGKAEEETPEVQEPSLSSEMMPLEAYLPKYSYYKYTMDNWRTGVTQQMEDAFFDSVVGLPATE